MQEWIEEQMDYMRRTQCTFQEGWEYCLRQMRKKAHLRRLEQAYQLSFAEVNQIQALRLAHSFIQTRNHPHEVLILH